MNTEQLKAYKREKSRQFNANLRELRLKDKAKKLSSDSDDEVLERDPPAGLILEDLFFKIEELESKLTDLLDVKFDELLDKLDDLLDTKFDDRLEELDKFDDRELETKPFERPPFQLQQNAFA